MVTGSNAVTAGFSRTGIGVGSCIELTFQFCAYSNSTSTSRADQMARDLTRAAVDITALCPHALVQIICANLEKHSGGSRSGEGLVHLFRPQWQLAQTSTARIDGNQRAFFQFGCHLSQGGDHLWPDNIRADALGADLHDTGLRTMRRGKDRAEIQIIGEHNIVLALAYAMISVSGALLAPGVDPCAALIPASANKPIQRGDRFISTSNFMRFPA